MHNINLLIHIENTEPRLLSNQNTAAVTGAALGLGIGIAGSILVGKLIEDANKCKPEDVQPPAFGRFLPGLFPGLLPDLLHLKPKNCNPQNSQANNYRQTQSYPSPGYVIPSASNQYHQQQSVESGYTISNLQQSTVSNGYNIPNLQQSTISSGYNVPNLHKQTASSGYNVPNLHKPTVSSGYLTPNQGYNLVPKNTYSPTASNQNSFSQTAPHKSSVDPPKETIELVNTDYTDYTEFSYTPNSAIQPRHLEEEALFKSVPTKKQRKPKSFDPSTKGQQFQASSFQVKPNSLKAFTPVIPRTQKPIRIENTFSQTAPHKAQPNVAKFQESEIRESKAIKQESSFQQTEVHTPKPDTPHSSNRQGKTLSSLTKFSVTKNQDQQKFQPLPSHKPPTPFLEAFKPISNSKFAPLPVDSEISSASSPEIVLSRARTPKLFGKGIVRFENKV